MMEKMPSATGEFLRQMAFSISYNGCLPGYGIACKMGKLLHDRLTIFAQRNNFYGVEHCLRWARVFLNPGR